VSETLPSRSVTTLPRRSVNSLRRRGLKPTLRYIRAYADDAWFDRRYGVQTDRWVALKDLEVVGDNKDQGGNYQPIKADQFRLAIRHFQIPTDGVFVDYGSGKGRVLFLAILYGFRRVVGIEFAPALCEEADRNFERFRRRTGRKFEAHVACVDAADYKVNDDDSVFFLNNPFRKRVLQQVLSNIRRSLESNPRSIHIVYVNPFHRRVLDDDSFWRMVAETDSGGLEPAVYYQPR
jgi:SAM-dependent methyltransferase